MAETAADLHERDFYRWTQEQAAILRRAGEQRLNAPPGIDWDNLAQEIWELGLSVEDELYHRYIVLLTYLLKRHHQPGYRGGSWRGSIREQRLRITRVLRRNPGVKPRRGAEFEEAYEAARERAAAETGLSVATFPETCLFTLEQAEDRDFWPRAEGGMFRDREAPCRP